MNAATVYSGWPSVAISLWLSNSTARMSCNWPIKPFMVSLDGMPPEAAQARTADHPWRRSSLAGTRELAKGNCRGARPELSGFLALEDDQQEAGAGRGLELRRPLVDP